MSHLRHQLRYVPDGLALRSGALGKEMSMLNVRFILTEPMCKLSEHYAQMIPSLHQKYSIKIETICKPAAYFETDEYFELDWPMPAGVMVEEEIVAEGLRVSQYRLESVICRHLGLPAPKFDRKAIYDSLIDLSLWWGRYRKKLKARNLGRKRTRKVGLIKTLLLGGHN